MDEQPYTSAEFHDEVHKQLSVAIAAALEEAKLEWQQVAPFLDAGRAMCREDFRLNGRLTLHGQEYEGADLVEAEEAYLAISVRDREDGVEWLSQTYWLSDIAIADGDPARIRAAVAALGRTTAKLRAWLAEHEGELPTT